LQIIETFHKNIKIALIICTLGILFSELLFKLWLKIQFSPISIRYLGDIPFNIFASLCTIIPFGLTCKTKLGVSITWASFLSAAFDLDHFVAAGSFSLIDAISLPHRPITHSFVIVFLFAVISSLITRSKEIGVLSFFSLCSHLLRDVWNGENIPFYPISLTSYHINYLLCLVLIISLPILTLMCGLLVKRINISRFWFADSESTKKY